MFDRLISLIGKENFNKIQNTNILLLGLGGVGSYSLESLVRNGFHNITVVDFDKIDITNLNRQLITNSNNIGCYKVDETIKRAQLINPNINITGIKTKLNEENIESIINNNYDYIIDAIDDINIKFLVMKYKSVYNYQLITCLGTAKKIDMSKLEIIELNKTINDPIARILRKKVRDNHLKDKFMCVYSNEIPLKSDILGSNNLVPSAAGLLLVSYVFNDIIKPID